MAPRSTRRYTYVDAIREIRRKASLGAMRVIREARRLGVPERLAKELADKVMLYELAPEAALRRLRELAERESRRRRV